MSNKILLSLAMVGLFAATAKADTSTTVETTTNWFAVVASSVDLSTNWGPVKPTREDAATVIAVDTSADAPAKYTPPETKPSASRYRVTGNMTVTLNAAVPGNDVFGDTRPKAALVAVAGDPNKWYAWHLTSDSAGEWVEMTTGVAPAEGNTYAVAIEFTSTTVSYTVAGTTKTLDNTPGGLSIASVGLAGYGSFGNFGAVGYEEFDVVVPAANIDDVKNAMKIDEITSETLNTKGDNGLTVWESIALGLDTTSTKPYTAPVQTSGNTLGFTIGNVDTSKYGATGATVTFDVVACNQDGSGETVINQKTAKNVAAGGTATVTPDPDNVKYYKIKIKITKPVQE